MINNSRTHGNRFSIVKQKFLRVGNDAIMITHYKINTKVVGRLESFSELIGVYGLLRVS